MRRIVRPWRLVALVLVIASLVLALLARATIAAQADAAVVLATVIETPVVTWSVERLTDEPAVADDVVAGAPTTLVRPSGTGPWPAVVFLNGATALGRDHPRVRAVARGLGRAGYLVLVPDLPGLREGEITTRTLAAAVRVVEAAASRSDAEGGSVGVLGVSVGGALALLTAEDPKLAARVAVVAAIAPYTDLAEVFRLATTGFYEEDGRLVRYETESFLALVAARSLVAALPPGRDRASLQAELRRIEDDEGDPLARLRSLARAGLGPAARTALALLLNRDPSRFEALYAALPPGVRAAHRRLSPLAGAARLQARVELASAPHDKYFPVAESRALARAAPDAHVTVTRSLAHAIPEPSPRDIADVFRFDGFAVRVLRHAAG